MHEAAPEFDPGKPTRKQKRPRRRVWLWAPAWLAGFLVLPGFLAGLIYKQRTRVEAEALTKASEAPTAIAPSWVPLGAEFRLEQSYFGESSGSATLLVRKPVESVADYYEAKLHASGFEVSRKLLERDHKISGAIINASHSAPGRFLLITLSQAGEATRIELSYSESR